MPWSRETFDAEIAHADAESLKWAEYRDQLKKLRAQLPVDIEKQGVIVKHKMQPQIAHRPARKVGRPVSVKHRFRSWLDGQSLNVKEWAEAHHRPQSTVRAWMRPLNDGGRRIPHGDALLIQNEAGKDDAGHWLLPATQTTWPNGFAP